MRGSKWDPWIYRAERHPDVQVVDSVPLQGGVQACISHRRRIIWLSPTLTPVEARCALAYEIGHLEFGPTPADPCMAAAHERAAVEWAALMLIPKDDFITAWIGCLDLVQMAAFCGVDLPTFRARIRAASNSEQDAAVQAIGQTRLTA